MEVSEKRRSSLPDGLIIISQERLDRGRDALFFVSLVYNVKTIYRYYQIYKVIMYFLVFVVFYVYFVIEKYIVLWYNRTDQK